MTNKEVRSTHLRVLRALCARIKAERPFTPFRGPGGRYAAKKKPFPTSMEMA